VVLAEVFQKFVMTLRIYVMSPNAFLELAVLLSKLTKLVPQILVLAQSLVFLLPVSATTRPTQLLARNLVLKLVAVLVSVFLVPVGL
jgi:hypothetical protein